MTKMAVPTLSRLVTDPVDKVVQLLNFYAACTRTYTSTGPLTDTRSLIYTLSEYAGTESADSGVRAAVSNDITFLLSQNMSNPPNFVEVKQDNGEYEDGRTVLYITISGVDDGVPYSLTDQLTVDSEGRLLINKN